MMDDDNQIDADVTDALSHEKRDVRASSKPLSSWYKGLLIFCAVLPLMVIVWPLLPLLGIGLLVLPLILLIKFYFFSKAGLHDRKGFLVPLIVFPLLLGFALIATFSTIGKAVDRMWFTGGEYKYFMKSFLFTFEEYEKAYGRLPEPERWCDVLKEAPETADIFPDKWARNMAMNKHLSEVDSDIPPDMVVLFDAKMGWNQAGGPELARGYNGSNCVRVVTGDWSVKRFHIDDVPYLQWRSQDDHAIPQVDITGRYKAAASLTGIAAAGVLILFFKPLIRYFPQTLLMGIFSAGIGFIFGGFSEGLHSLVENKEIGPVIGLIVGLAGGICFVPVAGWVTEKLPREVSPVGWSTMIGAMVGILCSCVVHGFLMIAYRETSLVNMAVGSAFGVWVGTMLGWITAWLMGRRLQKQQGQVKTTEVWTAAPVVLPLDSRKADA